MKFRKRPVVVEAVKWTGSNFDEVAEFFGTPAAIIEACVSTLLAESRLPIVTLEGVVTASPGDWIIRGVKGEYYPCKPDVFERTYEVADEETPSPAWNSPDVAERIERIPADDPHTDAGWLRDEHAERKVEVRTSGRDSGRNVETALAFLLTRIGSWTDARWDQHLRHEFGDERANQMIHAFKNLSGLE